MASSLDIAPALGHGIVTAQGIAGGYDAIDDRRQWGVGRQEGAVSAFAYRVSQRAEGTNLTLDVAADFGHYLVQGDDVDFQGLYLIPATALKANLDLADPPDITNPRVDLVVLEARDDAHTLDGITRGRVYVLSGTPTSGADVVDSAAYTSSLPTVPDSTAVLAEVVVDANATAITDAEIRDMRTFATGSMQYDVTTSAQLNVPIDSDVDRLVTIEVEGILSAYNADLLVYTNLGSINTVCAYDLATATSTPGSSVGGGRLTRSAVPLVFNPPGVASGSTIIAATCKFMVRPVSAGYRVAFTDYAASSTNGSANHEVTQGRVASQYQSGNGRFTSLAIIPSAGTFTGTVRVTRT